MLETLAGQSGSECNQNCAYRSLCTATLGLVYSKITLRLELVAGRAFHVMRANSTFDP